MDLNYYVLIVDDVAENIQVAMNILKEDHYNLAFARSGEEALALLETNPVDLVLLDVMMPGMDGFEVCQRMKQDPRFMDIPVIFLTARVDADSIKKGFEVGGVDYITKPFYAEELLARVKTHLELYHAKQVLEQNNLSLQTKLVEQQKRWETELELSQKEIIFMLMELVESVSDETGNHIRRVSEVSRLLAQYHPALTAEDEDMIYYAAPLHDVGKLAVPPELIHKTGKYTAEEYEQMKTHTTQAHRFLQIYDRKYIKAADVIAYQHHEKWDGSGYPQGLKGEEIHLYARVVALADVFDALVNKRSYKDAWPFEEAIDYIREQKGRHFDPTIADIFLAHQDEFVDLMKQYQVHKPIIQ